MKNPRHSERLSSRPRHALGKVSQKVVVRFGLFYFLGALAILILTFWIEGNSREKLIERAEWANAYSEIHKVAARLNALVNGQNLLYQLIYHVVANESSVSLSFVDSSSATEIPLLGKLAEDPASKLLFDTGITAPARKSKIAERQLELRIWRVAAEVINDKASFSSDSRLCGTISTALTKEFGEELVKKIRFQICAVSQFGVADWSYKAAWVVRCETSIRDDNESWKVAAKFQAGGGSTEIGPLAGVAACTRKEKPEYTGLSYDGFVTVTDYSQPAHFGSYDNTWRDRGFLSFDTPETVKWIPRMQFAILEKELVHESKSEVRMAKVANAKEKILERLLESQREVEVGFFGISLPARKILAALGVIYGFGGAFYFSLRYKVRLHDRACDSEIAASFPQMGSPVDPTYESKNHAKEWNGIARTLWALMLCLPVFVQILVLVRFQPLEFISRTANLTNIRGALSEWPAPAYALFSKETSLTAFALEAASIFGFYLYLASIQKLTQIGKTRDDLSSILGFQLLDKISFPLLVALPTYIVLRAVTTKPIVIGISLIVMMLVVAIANQLFLKNQLNLRPYLVALFCGALGLCGWVAFVLLPGSKSQVLATWAATLFCFTCAASSRVAIARGGRGSIILGTFANTAVVLIFGLELPLLFT